MRDKQHSGILYKSGTGFGHLAHGAVSPSVIEDDAVIVLQLAEST
jgi:hypothetical protein